MSEEDGYKVADLGVRYSEMDGYSAEARVCELLLAQVLFSNPDIPLLDEPTNNSGMELIESLNMAMDLYQGTLIFVPHGRESVISLANCVIEITPE